VESSEILSLGPLSFVTSMSQLKVGVPAPPIMSTFQKGGRKG
jgi:hypothetical protein